MSSSDPAARVRALLREALQIEVDRDDQDLLEEGLLDSLGLVSLITELEREFGFELALDTLDIDDFRSVERIVARVASESEAAPL